ncbi:MAG: hypothetical protein ACRCXC_07445 [Legionella sp.]
MNLEISKSTQKLLKKYWKACGIRRNARSSLSSLADLDTLLSWLSDEHPQPHIKSKEKKQHIEFLLVSLRAELLNDLYSSMHGDEEAEKEKRAKDTSGMGKIKFSLLTAAGILVAACQGFDGIVTMLSIFTLPSAIILGAGFLFSLFSIAVFCGFDLVKVSNSLGVKLSDSYKLLDAYLLQLQQIKAIRKRIEEYRLAELSERDLKQMELIVSMLQKRFESLSKAGKQFDEALNSDNMQMAKTLMSVISALLFFGGGFFAGQSVALFVASLVINPVIPAFWPVIIFSTVVGLAALSIYWYVERPGLNKLVSSWFGLNAESVEQLCDNDLLVEEEKKLKSLKGKITSTAQLTNKVVQLAQRLMYSDVTDESLQPQIVFDTRASANFYSFLKPPGLVQKPSAEEEHTEQVVCCAL